MTYKDTHILFNNVLFISVVQSITASSASSTPLEYFLQSLLIVCSIEELHGCHSKKALAQSGKSLYSIKISLAQLQSPRFFFSFSQLVPGH